jgi:hypothetical protein
MVKRIKRRSKPGAGRKAKGTKMRLSHMLIGAAILLAAAFATNLVWRSDPSHADGDKAMLRTIAVAGEGRASARPDQAEISTGVVTDGATAKDALAKNTARMAEVIAALKKMGVAEKDIQTSGFTLQPIYLPQGPGQNAPRIGGYQAANNVTVKIRDLDKLGDILDQVVQTGSNSVGGVSFSIAEPEPLMTQAREAAIANARARAETYAKAAGVKLGKVMNVSEGSAPPPVPVYAARSAEMAPSAAVPVEPGQQQVMVMVSVVFEIN